MNTGDLELRLLTTFTWTSDIAKMSEDDTQRISPDYTFTSHSSNPSPNGDPTIASPIVQPVAGLRPSLRSRLSRQFGLSRLPRRARAKSLTRPRPGQQQTQGQYQGIGLHDLPLVDAWI